MNNVNVTREKSLENYINKNKNQSLFEELSKSSSSNKHQLLQDVKTSFFVCAYEFTYGAIMGTIIGGLSNRIIGDDTIPLMAAALVGGAIKSEEPIKDLFGQLGLYQNKGDLLIYNPDNGILIRTSDYETARKHHYLLLEEMQQPYLLNANRKEAAIMDVTVHEVGDKGHIASLTRGVCELVANIEGIAIKEHEEGKGAIQRIGQREFKVLAFAPYHTFM